MLCGVAGQPSCHRADAVALRDSECRGRRRWAIVHHLRQCGPRRCASVRLRPVLSQGQPSGLALERRHVSLGPAYCPMNWDFLTWLLPWRAKREIERLRKPTQDAQDLAQIREQLRASLESLEHEKSEARRHERQKKGLIRFILVSHRLHVPPEPGTIREQLLRP